MKKMTPREALYHICLHLCPVQTNRDDNIQHDEAVLRDSVRTLQNFITYHDDADSAIPLSANEYLNHSQEHSKINMDNWREESKRVYQNTSSGSTKY